MKGTILFAVLACLQCGCMIAADAEEPYANEYDNDSATPNGLAGSLAATRDDNMGMGNPSDATASTANADNFLMVKPQYALSYNNSRGGANWVSWHLSTAWKGDAPRQDSFKSDSSLPSGFIKAATSWYTNTGFDRGHMCPSEDRDASTTDNAATFLMTNILPQAPDNNRITWKALEDYSRKLIEAGNELYIIAGPSGSGGQGSNGSATSIHSGDVKVPSHYWKVIVVLPVGSNDVGRVGSSTRVIAVKMPNDQSVDTKPWFDYRVSVDSLEGVTGYDFLSNVSSGVQGDIEAVVDNGPTQ